MRALHTVLICLIVCSTFTHTAAAVLGTLIQQDDNMILNERAASHHSPKISRKRLPDLTILGDPIEDPTPHKY